MAEKRANREKASPLRGEARASGAGELLCGVTSRSSSESEGGRSGRSAESEGSGEGSGLASGAREGDLLPISGGTEAEPYGAREQSERRSESANRAEHDQQSGEPRRSLASEETIQHQEGEARASPSFLLPLSQSVTIGEELLEI